MSGMTRGPLPARVYWVRRLMVLAIALLLVVGVAKLLGGSSDARSGGSSGDGTARQAAASAPVTGGASTSTSVSHPSGGKSHAHHGKRKSGAPVTPVAMPSGPCAASDVAITPSVPRPVAGRDIRLVLDISTVNSPACTWTLSARTMALKITSGSDLIWTTTECAHAIPKEDLVLRQASPTKVRLTWNAQRSEPGCPARSQWALPGTYHLHVAALAGRPQDVAFLLTAPAPPQVTRTARPHHRHHRRKSHT